MDVLKSLRKVLFSDSWVYFFFICAIAVQIVCIYNFALSKRIDRDEIEYIHGAWNILQGQRIYVDFFEHHNPLYYYCLLPLLKIFPQDTNIFFIGRALTFVLFLIILYVIYLIAKNSFSQKTAIITVLLLCITSNFLKKIIEIRSDVPETLFALISVLFLMFYFNSDKIKHLILSAFFLVVSFFFIQKSIVLLLVIEILFLLEKRCKDAAVYMMFFLSMIFPYFVYLAFTQQLEAYLVSNWTVNLHFIKGTVTKGIAENVFTIEIIKQIKGNALTWLYWVFGLALLKSDNQKRLALISLGLLLSFFFIQIPYGQYFLLILPFIAMVSAHALKSVTEKLHYPLFNLLILSTVFSLTSFVNRVYLLNNNNKIELAAELRRLDFVLRNTSSNDYVYDGEGNFNLFRKGVDKFSNSKFNGWASYIYKRILGEPCDENYTLIDRLRPKIISNGELDVNNPIIRKNYIQISRFPDLYIRKRKK